jgi:hypothetical protein
MKTFYDRRSGDRAPYNTSIDEVEATVIWKTKTHWLIYVDKNDYYSSAMSFRNNEDMYHTDLIGYIVIPKGVIIQSCYIAKSFWDGVKALFRSGETPAVTKTKGEFPEELL